MNGLFPFTTCIYFILSISWTVVSFRGRSIRSNTWTRQVSSARPLGNKQRQERGHERTDRSSLLIRAAAATPNDAPNSGEPRNNASNDNINSNSNKDDATDPPKLPRAMIKSSEEEGKDTTAPPEIFDTGVGSKNKPGRKSPSAGGRVGARDGSGSGSGVSTSLSSAPTTVSYNWKYGLCRHAIAFEAAETIKRMRFKVCSDAKYIPYFPSHA